MSIQNKTKRMFAYTPDYAVAPGVTLSEVLQSLAMTQKECALRCGLTEQTMVRIIKGEQPITYETADRLEMVTGVPASLWNTLELQYQNQVRKIKQNQAYEQDIRWLDDIPTKELKKRGFLAHCDSKAEMVGETLRFYGVASIKAWNDVWMDPTVAARRSDCFETSVGSASAWIRLGELQAQGITCTPYDAERFKRALHEIRTMTLDEPASFVPKMRKLCASCGVALALVPTMRKVPWNGASKWLSPTKAMILISLRGKAEDVFWFSFFHEAGHILFGEKKRLYIAEDRNRDKQELEADAFAANLLIPESYNQDITKITASSEVLAVAKTLAISPGIVAGRYRHLTGNCSFFKDLTRSFDWDTLDLEVSPHR